MSVRSLLPWLLLGGLIVSAYTNIVMATRTLPPAWQEEPARSNSQPSVHYAPGSRSERCPTLEVLGLDQEQRASIRKCSLTSLSVRTDLALEIEQATASLDDLLGQEVVPSDLVMELAERIAQLRSRQYKTWISSILVVREVLTPEQLQVLHNLELN